MAQAAPPTHSANQYVVANHTSTTKSWGSIKSGQNLQRGFAGPREPNVPMTPRSAGRASDPPPTPTPAAPSAGARATLVGLCPVDHQQIVSARSGDFEGAFGALL